MFVIRQWSWFTDKRVTCLIRGHFSYTPTRVVKFVTTISETTSSHPARGHCMPVVRHRARPVFCAASVTTPRQKYSRLHSLDDKQGKLGNPYIVSALYATVEAIACEQANCVPYTSGRVTAGEPGNGNATAWVGRERALLDGGRLTGASAIR